MTQEDKQLLLKDLCMRLPYRVKVKHGRTISVLSVNIMFDIIAEGTIPKPYLRPMSSMTEEELNECVCQSGIKDIECPNWQDILKEK